MSTKYIANTDRALIGLDKFHYAPLIEDSPAGIEYGAQTEFPNTIEMTVAVNGEVVSLYADNKPAIVHSSIGNVELTLTKTVIPNEVLGEWLGSPMDGGTRHMTSAQGSPYFGVSWRQVYSDGKYSYIKLYKGKFTEPDKSATTKEETVDFQTAEISAQFASTVFEETMLSDGELKKFSMLMSIAEEDSPGYTNEGKDWFKTMYVPNGEDILINTYADRASNISKTQWHFHSDKSDGKQTYEAMYQAYKDAGYDVINRTDHNNAEGSKDLAGITVMRGLEQSTTEGVHVGVWNLPGSGDALYQQPIYQTGGKNKDLSRVVQYYRDELGLMVVANHPGRTKSAEAYSVSDIVNNDFKIMEIYNGKYDENYEDLWDAVLTSGHRIWGMSSDDCHDALGRAFDVGFSNVYVKDKSNAEQVMEALANGHFIASNNHMLTVNEVTDNSIRITSPTQSNFQLITENGEIVKEVKNQLSTTFADIDTQGKSYFRVKSISVADPKKYANSQPFYTKRVVR